MNSPMNSSGSNYMPSKFHQVQYCIAAVLFLACLMLYFYAPTNKAETLAGMVGVFGGFVTGKFSNGFSRSRPTRWDDALEAKSVQKGPDEL